MNSDFEEVWDEIYRLKRTIADLRVAIRELSERVAVVDGVMAPLPEPERPSAMTLPSRPDGEQP